MTLQIDVRSGTADDWPGVIECDNAAFAHEMIPDVREHFATLVEPSRLIVASEAETIVGGAGTFPLQMTVPGGELPTAGLTLVSVRPTHRRRGILRQMMRQMFVDINARGEALSILWASEAAIYQRFGYGIGTLGTRIDLERGHDAMLGHAEPVGRTRLLSHDEALEQLPPIYERIRRTIPGMLERTRFWWDQRRLADFDWIRRGGSQLFRVVLAIDGHDEAYTLYRVHNQWSDEGRRQTWLDVHEAVGTTPPATREIWRYLFGIDLVTRVRSRSLPLDHPLHLSLVEPRRLRLQVADGLWVRVVDARAALAGRTYNLTDTLTIELHDDGCPWNDGTWRLDASPDGAQVTRVSTAPDLSLSAAELSAMYLGGVTCTNLWRAGRIEERTPGAVRRADLLFGSAVLPWCPDQF